MDQKVEEKIEKEMGKKAVKDIKKEIDIEVAKEVKKEIKKRLHVKIYEDAKGSALKLKDEFKKEVIVAVSAALGFLIALSWRTPLKNSVDLLIANLGLSGKAVYVEFLSAMIITLIAVFCLMLMSKWKVKD